MEDNYLPYKGETFLPFPTLILKRSSDLLCTVSGGLSSGHLWEFLFSSRKKYVQHSVENDVDVPDI